ncbi:MAG: HD domain-containing protein [Fibrobacteria bacterium]|nr:HD domain-containing protein [Fibrobacteria bacterium]
MIQVTKDELKSGMVLAKSIYGENGELLLANGYTINDKVLRKLKQLELPYFWIQEEGTEFIIPEQIISDKIAYQSHEAIRQNMNVLKDMMRTQDLTSEGLGKFMEDKKKFKNILIAENVKRCVGQTIDSIIGMESVLVNLASIRTKAGFLYQHCLDVTITAIILANKFHFNRFELEELALGCMLMDLGMTVIPDEITNKTSRLSFQEFSLLKEHATYGYFILRENTEIPLTSAHIAYQHHERQDGAGYPRNLRGNNQVPVRRLTNRKGIIHRYAEIAAVADTYIALVSPRPHTVPKSPKQAIRTLITAAASQLNRTVVDTLITLIPIYPVGTRIEIVKDVKYNMTGYTGIVSRYRHDAPDKPTVMIMFNCNKEKIKPKLIDLLEEPEIKIQFVVLS